MTSELPNCSDEEFKSLQCTAVPCCSNEAVYLYTALLGGEIFRISTLYRHGNHQSLEANYCLLGLVSRLCKN